MPIGKRARIALVLAGAIGVFVLSSVVNTARLNAEYERQARELEGRGGPIDGDRYLAMGEEAKRRHVREHKGEPLVGGLRIGMTRAEALAALPGGKDAAPYPDVVRYPLPSRPGREVLARMIDDKVCYATEVAAGTDPSGFDLAAHYGEPKGHEGSGG